MDPTIYIPVIAALVGAFVGASIKELSSFYVMRREDKRILKKVLFNQLDVWYEVRRLHFGPMLTMYLKVVSEKLSRGGVPQELIYSELEKQRPLFNTLFRQIRLGEPGKVQPRYQDAVNELAKVDPVLAFRISGRPEFENDLGKLDAFANKMTEVSTKGSDLEAMGKLMEQVEPTYEELTVIRTLRNLQEDIWRVSRKIGFVTCFRTLWLMHKIKTRTADENDPETDRLLEPIINLLLPMLKSEMKLSPEVTTQPASPAERSSS